MASAADIFSRAVELPRERRDQFVASCTKNAPELRDEVRSLLASHDALGDFLDAPDFEGAQPSPEPGVHDVPGHELTRKLGEGGFGTVHLARELGTLQREVAVKFLKRDLVSPKALARFDNERQILANLQHDGIANIFTAGTAAAGCPYYTMEWVDGPPIDEHCDEQRLDLTQRVDLFLPVCRAVAHAHQRGVIHGDLKPRNVLVCRHSDDPSPKVIDFGVARSLGDPAASEGSAGGTPRYMSPEQRAGNPADMRCDVYSLGVLLHDLLVGRHRGDRSTNGSGDSSTQRTLDILPDDASAELAQRRNTTPGKLRRQLVGDLDHIVRSATRTDPDARYETVRELIADLEAWRERRPLPSHPGGLFYRLRRWLARHPVGAGAALAFALGAGVFVWKDERNATRIAETERSVDEWSQASGEMLAFVEDLLLMATPSQEGPSLSLERAAALAQERYEAAPPNKPVVAARLAVTLGRLRSRLDQKNEAARLFRQAKQQLARTPNASPLAVAMLDIELAHAAGQLQHTDESRALLAGALQRLEGLPEDDQVFRVRQLARRGIAFGKLHGGEPQAFLADMRTIQRDTLARFGAEHAYSREIATLMADAELNYGSLDRADELRDRNPAATIEAIPQDWTYALRTKLVAARRALESGDEPKATRLAEEVLATVRERGGSAGGRQAIAAREVLAIVATRAHKHEAALEHLQEVFALEHARHGPGHRQTLRAARNVAAGLSNLDRLDDADAFLAANTPAADDEIPDRVQLMSLLQVRATVASRRKDYGTAIATWDRVVAGNTQLHGGTHRRTIESRRRRAAVRTRAGEHTEALAELAEIQTLATEQLGEAARQTLGVMSTHAYALDRSGAHDEALQLLQRRLATALAAHGPAHGTTQEAIQDLGGLCKERDQLETFFEAAETVRAAFVEQRQQHPDDAALERAFATFRERLASSQRTLGRR